MAEPFFDVDKWIEREELSDGPSWYEEEKRVADGVWCSGPFKHLIRDHDDEDVIYHNGLPYCEDCLKDLGVYPSDDYWAVENREFWDVQDTGAYDGEDEL